MAIPSRDFWRFHGSALSEMAYLAPEAGLATSLTDRRLRFVLWKSRRVRLVTAVMNPQAIPDLHPRRRRLIPVLLAPFSIIAASCGAETPPTAADIRIAYAAHVAADTSHGRGLNAVEAPAVIPFQEPKCSADGNYHFDCRITVIFETPAGRRSQEQAIHIRRSADEWHIDSIN